MEPGDAFQKLVDTSEILKNKLLSVDFEERRFYTAMTIFDSLIRASLNLDIENNRQFVSTLANGAITAADIFLENYANRSNS